MSIYENKIIMFSTIKSLHIFHSNLFYCILDILQKLIEWLANNKFNYLNLYWRESSHLVALNLHSI